MSKQFNPILNVATNALNMKKKLGKAVSNSYINSAAQSFTTNCDAKKEPQRILKGKLVMINNNAEKRYFMKKKRQKEKQDS